MCNRTSSGAAKLCGIVSRSLYCCDGPISITFGAAAAYWAVSRVMPVLVKKAVVCGLLYGVVVYGITNYVIVPLSKIGHVLPGSPAGKVIGLVILMVCVGLPIALMARRYS